MREKKTTTDDYIHVTLTYLITIVRMMLKISLQLKTVAKKKKKKDNYFHVTLMYLSLTMKKGCGENKDSYIHFMLMYLITITGRMLKTSLPLKRIAGKKKETKREKEKQQRKEEGKKKKKSRRERKKKKERRKEKETERKETEKEKEKRKERKEKRTSDEETNNLNKIVAHATYELQDEWEIFWNAHHNSVLDLALNNSFLSDCLFTSRDHYQPFYQHTI